ncbi:hypothetical protein [Hymenobacter aranciens]|nr:hypothetical protein [Hymenobacter sp. ASUV-10]
MEQPAAGPPRRAARRQGRAPAGRTGREDKPPGRAFRPALNL